MPIIAKDSYADWMKALAEQTSKRRLPKFIDLAALPPLTSQAGDQLPEELVKRLLLDLLGRETFAPEDLTTALRGWRSPASGDALAWRLFEAWRDQGFKKANAALLYPIGFLGDDMMATRLSEHIESWSKKRQTDIERASATVPALAAVGNEAAARELIRLSRKILPTPVGAAISVALDRMAEARGVTRATLREQLLPWREELLSLGVPKKLPNVVDVQKLPPLYAAEAPEAPLDRKLTEATLRAFIGGPETLAAFRDPLRAYLEPRSADALALALLESWRSKDFNGRFRWILEALGTLGGDRTALALEPYLISWPLESETGRKRALEALEVFRQIGTDTALLVLFGLSIKPVKPSVYERAAEVLQGAASDRQLSIDELGDRVTPHCGLDAQGSRTFDYGPRQFQLVFNEHFDPCVRDSKNTLFDRLPKGRQEDDPAKVAESRQAWELMYDQLREITKVQNMRFAQLMVTRRRWKVADWSSAIFGHPLLINYARRLLWGVYGLDGALEHAFRAAEDITLVDLEDDELILPEVGEIGLVHPLDLDEEGRARWVQHFLSYELIPPFHQLQRRLFTVSPDEVGTKSVGRYAETKFKAKAIHDGMIRLVWMREPGYVRTYFEKHFRGAGILARIHIEPGIHAGNSDSAEDQTVPSITFLARSKRWAPLADGNGQLPVEQVDPVVFSETILGVETILEPPQD